MHILIIEPLLTGHHSVYLEHIASSYLGVGHDVTVAMLEDATDHPVIERLRSEFPSSFGVLGLTSVTSRTHPNRILGQIGREFAGRQLFERAFLLADKDRHVDFVFIPYLDYCLYALALLGSPFRRTKWAGICMRPTFHYRHFPIAYSRRRLDVVKGWLFARLLRSGTLVKVLTIDELLHRYVTSTDRSMADRVRYLPDPAELVGDCPSSAARAALSIPQNASVVLVYGSIDERKGLDILLNAIDSPQVPSNIHVLVAGIQSATGQRIMQSGAAASLMQQKRLHVINKFVSKEEEQMLFAAASIVWLGYRNHFTMSGVLVLAAQARRPVIATQDGLIGWHTKRDSLGMVLNVEDIETVRNALTHLRCEALPSTFAVGPTTSWDAHTWSSFEQALAGIIPRAEAAGQSRRVE